ncbi:hypothetical protein GCM10009811_14030 [Nostocoides veronense]|uniref:Uncharacterized protein n=1 Tax=Nostocoides veronense TaxID=330836 RepID=A0ABP4XSZ6_9MICO
MAGHPASRAGFVNASSAREGRAREAAQHRRIARAQGYGPGSPVLTRRTDRDGRAGYARPIGPVLAATQLPAKTNRARMAGAGHCAFSAAL